MEHPRSGEPVRLHHRGEPGHRPQPHAEHRLRDRPNRGDVSSDYSTLVYAPDNTAANVWTGVDTPASTGAHWGLTGSKFAGTPCDINGARCTFEEMQNYLNDGGDPATIYTVQITKGRDYAFSGAVDQLRINDTVYDFEPFGVYATKVS